jgi:peptide deformylase
MLLMKDIVRDGHQALRKKSMEVDLPPHQADIQLLHEMMDFIKNSQDEAIAEKYNLRPGVGLAAPQLGINKRLITVHFTHDEQVYSYQLINPKIISHSVEGAFLGGGEGCLSVDENIEGYVVRHRRITVRAYDQHGKQVKIRLKGYPAIVMQHEIDHLDGIMFYDYINPEQPFHIPDNAHLID